MLTIDFERFAVGDSDRLLDLGCGAGRHTFEALRRGARVIALDRNVEELRGVQEMVTALAESGDIKPPGGPVTLEGDALALPFEDGTFDRVLASEILEHIPDDHRAISEIARVVRSGGLVAISVPRYWPERICWALSHGYHEVDGGHVRIYRGDELISALAAAGLEHVGTHHAHALHSPYWWLKCATGRDSPGDNRLTRAYHRMLVWDMMKRPWLTQTAERLLNPVLGKSLVVYLHKP